jgi:NAD(P)-dependent dehydrogenase (short-subunit alcohol dehydrogenase family)
MSTAALIVGGSSGLGLALAHRMSDGHSVHTTGRQNPHVAPLHFHHLKLGASQSLAEDLDRLVAELPPINLFIYAAGFYQEGRISELTDAAITEMTHVGLLAPAMLMQRLLRKQNHLDGLIAITSTSQWVPRPLESMYNATKAALGMFANAVAMDDQVGKVMVIAPGGMNTPFYRGWSKDMNDMLDPTWVAEKIVALYDDHFQYKFARILRNPARVEIVETRSIQS